jgi:hypothetical protein
MVLKVRSLTFLCNKHSINFGTHNVFTSILPSKPTAIKLYLSQIKVISCSAEMSHHSQVQVSIALPICTFNQLKIT